MNFEPTTRWFSQSLTIRGRDKLRCQDAAWSGSADSRTVLVIADGVGGHEWADLAAQTAVVTAQNAVAYVSARRPRRQDFTDEIVREVRSSWSEWHLAQTSRHQGILHTDTTLAIAVLDSEGLSLRYVGDCIAIVDSIGMTPTAAVIPTRDEFGGVDTLGHFCRGDIQPARLELHDPGLTAVLLSTDGIERVLQQGQLSDQTTSVFDVIDPYVSEILSSYRQTFDIGHVIRELSAGLIHAPGSKGDDIGVALAVR